MDYEKLHKDTIAKLQEMVNSGKITVEVARGICADFVPESEDEKIMGEFRDFAKNYLFWGKSGLTKEKALAWLEKQGEQKPAWSEEDERNLEGIIDEIEANKNFAPESDLVTYDRYLSWLKSIRTKNTWKPSDEQMDALETAVSSLQSNTLKSLYQDLKREKNHE